MLVVLSNMTAVQDKLVAHKLMMVDTFEDTVVGDTEFVHHTMFVGTAFEGTAFEGTAFEGTAFEGTAHMLYMVVLRMPAAAVAAAVAVAVAVAVASADQHMVAHIQLVYTALPVLYPLLLQWTVIVQKKTQKQKKQNVMDSSNRFSPHNTSNR